MKTVHRFFAVAAKISWLLSAVGMAGLMFLVLAIVADVFMRLVFNRPITGVRDMQSLFIAASVSMMFPLLIMLEGNIVVNFIDAVKSRGFLRGVRVFANVFSGVMMGLVSWQVWKYAAYMAENNEQTIHLGQAMSPWWRFAAVMLMYATFMSLYAVCRTLRPESEDGRTGPENGRPPV